MIVLNVINIYNSQPVFLSKSRVVTTVNDLFQQQLLNTATTQHSLLVTLFVYFLQVSRFCYGMQYCLKQLRLFNGCDVM